MDDLRPEAKYAVERWIVTSDPKYRKHYFAFFNSRPQDKPGMARHTTLNPSRSQAADFQSHTPMSQCLPDPAPDAVSSHSSTRKLPNIKSPSKSLSAPEKAELDAAQKELDMANWNTTYAVRTFPLPPFLPPNRVPFSPWDGWIRLGLGHTPSLWVEGMAGTQ